MEIPIDLINQVQISLRRHANLSSYDPDGASLVELPSAEEAVAALDPSPPNLRCRHCKGRLLRGLDSSFCVFCGRAAFDDVVPDPINFRNTLGYLWLLQSLELDGSDIVSPSVEANSTQRGRSATKDELPLSDLLDLEIKWPSFLERHESQLSKEKPIQSKTPVNLSGVNTENFFANEEKGTTSNASRDFSAPVNQIYAKDGNEVHNNLNLFEHPQPGGDDSNEFDSGWGADFQSAPSGTKNVESTSFEPFVGSEDLSAHMDEVFGSAKDFSIDTKSGAKSVSSSMANDWFADDPWSNSNTGLTGPSQEIKASGDLNPLSLKEEDPNSSSARDVDWVQDGRWQSDSKKELGRNADDGDDDSFGDWNDFASSTTAQNPSTTWAQSTIPPDEQTSEMNFVTSAKQTQDISFFDSFSQPDLFPGEANKSSSEAYNLDRKADLNTKAIGDSDDAQKQGAFSSPESSSKASDVEMILSQMHDLSFMLDANLSIPSKQDDANSLSRD